MGNLSKARRREEGVVVSGEDCKQEVGYYIQEEGRRLLRAEHVVAGAAMSSYEWWLGLEDTWKRGEKGSY